MADADENSDMRRSGRERKAVQPLDLSSGTNTPKREVIIWEGEGTPLGDIPRVAAFFAKKKSDDAIFKFLHMALWRTPGKSSVRKRDLRRFKGWPKEKSAEMRQQVAKSLSKGKAVDVKAIAKCLDVTGTGSKEEVCERVAIFLESPMELKSAIPQKKRKRETTTSKSSGKKKRAAKHSESKDSAKEGESSNEEESSDKEETRKRAKVDDECADNCLKRMTDALQKAVQEEGTDSINSGAKVKAALLKAGFTSAQVKANRTRVLEAATDILK